MIPRLLTMTAEEWKRCSWNQLRAEVLAQAARVLELEQQLGRALVSQNQNAAAAVVENERANRASARITFLEQERERIRQALEFTRESLRLGWNRLDEEQRNANLVVAIDGIQAVLTSLPPAGERQET